MPNRNEWKEYFNLRKKRSPQIKELITKYQLTGDPKQICSIILDYHEVIPSTLDTTPLDLFKLLYACINERTKISIKLSDRNIDIEEQKRIQKLVPLLEETFIREINKPHNKVYFLVLIQFLKWENNNTQIQPAKIIPQTLKPNRTISNTEEYHVYDENDNKLELVGIDHKRIDNIFKRMTDAEKEGNSYYISYLLDSISKILRKKQIFNPNLKFIGNKEAAFLYDLLPILGIKDLAILSEDVSNIEKRDIIRTIIRRVNKFIYTK